MAVNKPTIAEVLSTPNKNGYAGERRVEAVVVHITQGGELGVKSWFANPESRAATHYLVCRDGRIIQFCDPRTDSPLANGKVGKPNLTKATVRRWVDAGINPNLRTVSIECEGWSGQPITEAQVESITALTAWLCQEFALAPSAETILKHADIDAVDRAGCPGPAYPYEQIVSAVQERLAPKPDDEPSDWAQEAWAWGIAQGITDGTNPHGACTREQVVTMIHRALGAKKTKKGE